MNLDARVLERVTGEFPAAEQGTVLELLAGYAGPERGRVVWDVLVLSKGSMAEVRKFVAAAQVDYRDVLYWAEYYASDPLVQGQDAKALAQDLIARLNGKKSGS